MFLLAVFFLSTPQTPNAQSFVQDTCLAQLTEWMVPGMALLFHQMDLVVDWKMTVLCDGNFQRVEISLYFMSVRTW